MALNRTRPANPSDQKPNSYYAVAKAAATMYCSYTSQKIERPITTLRLYSAYGPFEEPSRLMPTLIKKGLQGELPPLVSPDTARDFIYIDDVCEAYIQAGAQQNAGIRRNSKCGNRYTAHHPRNR